MEGLLRRLSSNESEAESALRVIAFFDRLIETRAGIDDLVRSSARLVGAVAGFSAPDHSAERAFDSRGRAVRASSLAGAVRKSVTLDEAELGSVWVDQAEDSTVLAELVVERMALAAATILRRASPLPMHAGKDSLLVLLDSNETPENRAKSLESLGFRRDWNVRVMVATTQDLKVGVGQMVGAWMQSSGVRSTPSQVDDSFYVWMMEDRGSFDTGTMPDWPFLSALGARTSALEAAYSFESARAAIRLTSATLGPRRVDYEALGPLSHLIQLSSSQASSTQFVRQFAFLAESETGSAELLALDAFCRFRSLRTASLEMNLHHSSLAHRLKKVEKKLHVDLGDPTTVFLLAMSLQLYRISTWT
jgi:hypothetical protein